MITSRLKAIGRAKCRRWPAVKYYFAADSRRLSQWLGLPSSGSITGQRMVGKKWTQEAILRGSAPEVSPESRDLSAYLQKPLGSVPQTVPFSTRSCQGNNRLLPIEYQPQIS